MNQWAVWLQRVSRLCDLATALGIALWGVVLWWISRQHVVLSTPGVEKDFRVFALRSEQLIGQWPAGTRDAALDGVLRADGFYNLGYPFLLWVVRPFTEQNPFLAGRMLAVVSGVLLLLASWWLARMVLGPTLALLTTAFLATSPLLVQYSLYLGSDMPFAAATTLALACLLAATRSPHPTRLLIAAGVCTGLAFLVRHPGLLLLVPGVVVSWWCARQMTPQRWWQLPLIFLLAFLIIIGPQLAVNLRDTGQLFFSQQAKNVWHAVVAGGDWGRWGEVSDDISFWQILVNYPGALLTNWWASLRAFIGTGGEDTSEFGRAIQLRLLGFPANWLALGGLLGWVFRARQQRPFALLLGWVGLYVVALSVGFVLPRFFLPLLPIYALAAGWAGAWVLGVAVPTSADPPPAQPPATPMRPWLAAGVGVLLLASLARGPIIGWEYVLRDRTSSSANLPGQPINEAAVARLVLATLPQNSKLTLVAARDNDDARELGKYSALAHRIVVAPEATLAGWRATGAAYLLYHVRSGVPAPDLREVDQAGEYRIYELHSTP
jgi:hypothetical protein